MNPNQIPIQMFDQMALIPNTLVFFQTISINLQLIDGFISNPAYYNSIINNFLKFIHILRFNSHFNAIIEQLTHILEQIANQQPGMLQTINHIIFIINANHPFYLFQCYYMQNVQGQLQILQVIDLIFSQMNQDNALAFQYLTNQQIINNQFTNPLTQIAYQIDNDNLYYLFVKHSNDISQSPDIFLLHDAQFLLIDNNELLHWLQF
ncbi:hypothetical protein ABPG74_011123 [Tetrahymena malaccensis]